MEKRIPVIIPAYEPDEKMIRLLQTLQESGIERIVVVDDGSGNEYRNLFEQAKQLGAIVLTHAVNLGKGRALKTAFNEVLNRYRRRSERLPRIRTDNIRPPAFRNVWKRWKKSRKS